MQITVTSEYQKCQGSYCKMDAKKDKRHMKVTVWKMDTNETKDYPKIIQNSTEDKLWWICHLFNHKAKIWKMEQAMKLCTIYTKAKKNWHLSKQFLNFSTVRLQTEQEAGRAEGSDPQELMLTPSQSEAKWPTSSKKHQAFPGKTGSQG